MGKVTLIAATSLDNIIGLTDGGMPWPRHSGDLSLFKELTMGSIVLVGRKTWETLPVHETGVKLPGRNIIILTNTGTRDLYKDTSVLSKGQMDNWFRYTRRYYEKGNVYIIGGGEIYNYFLNDKTVSGWVDELVLTTVWKTVRQPDEPKDKYVYFPDFDESEWKLYDTLAHNRMEDGTSVTTSFYKRH